MHLDASQIHLKDLVSPLNAKTPQPKHIIHNENKPEEEINTLKLEAQSTALKSYLNSELSTINSKSDSFSHCLIKMEVAIQIMKMKNWRFFKIM